MRRVFAIAHNTFRETYRDRVVWIIFGFALLLVVLSNLIAYMGTPGANDDPVQMFSRVGTKIVADFGLTAIWALSLLIAIFIGTGMIHKEIDKRTIYTILSRPVYRWEFIVGKYFGLLFTLILLISGMAAFFFLHYALQGGLITWALIQTVLLMMVEMAVVIGLAVFFGSVGSPILSAIMTAFVVLIGHMAIDIVELSIVGDFEKMTWLLYLIYTPLPQLHNFDTRTPAVHNIAQNFDTMILNMTYAATYVAGLLALSVLTFRRRNL